MKVLISIKNGQAHSYVVTLPNKSLIHEVLDLVEKNKHSQAVMKVLSKGRLDREISGRDVHRVKADLILSERNVRWDLKK